MFKKLIQLPIIVLWVVFEILAWFPCIILGSVALPPDTELFFLRVVPDNVIHLESLVVPFDNNSIPFKLFHRLCAHLEVTLVTHGVKISDFVRAAL